MIESKRTLNAVVACVIGALLGTYIANHVWTPHFIWVGTLTGGAIGYIFCDLDELCSAVHSTWKAMRKQCAESAPKIQKAMLKGLKDIVLRLLIFLTVAVVILSIISVNAYAVRIVDSQYLHWLKVKDWGDVLGQGTVTAIIMWFIGIVALIASIALSEDLNKALTTVHEKHTWTVPALLLTPLLFPLVPTMLLIALALILFLVRFVPMLATDWKRLLVSPFTFLWSVFTLIHSEKRLICLVIGSTATVTGFYAQSYWWAGATACALFVIQYEVVAKRWLRLIPVAH